MKNKKILLFPGQGSQYGGMSKEIAEKFPKKAAEIHECGSDILGYDLKELLYNGGDEKLSDTLYAQPAIFAASLISLIAVQESGALKGGFAAAGHSLGEYAALVACGVMTTEAGFKAIKARAEIMSRAGQVNPGSMAAVIGASYDDVCKACEQVTSVGGYVTLANYNSPQQCVISGEKHALAQAEELLKTLGIKRLKIVPLKVSAAFHSKMMKTAAEEFAQAAKKLTYSQPEQPFYSNLTAGKITEISAEYLSTHIISPVMFVPQLQKIHSDKFDIYIEVGPGKVLSGLVSKTLPCEEIRVLNVENESNLADLAEVKA
ncbi:MAG: ACP S-malonyltransferase [Oscillospiraceae bacterium]|nr:ACP S-malonyltransferase [Oscillospiraceae bacterium]